MCLLSDHKAILVEGAASRSKKPADSIIFTVLYTQRRHTEKQHPIQNTEPYKGAMHGKTPALCDAVAIYINHKKHFCSVLRCAKCSSGV